MKSLKLFFILTILFGSCSNSKKEIIYKTYSSKDKSYIVEIPDNIPLHFSHDNNILFATDDKNLIICIEPFKGKDLKTFNESIKKDLQTQYTIVHESDSAIFYNNDKTVSCNLYMLKRFPDISYIICLTNKQRLNLIEAEDIIKHIHATLTTDLTANTSEPIQEYSNAFFSVVYPAKWKITENPDYMSDIYIGAEDMNIGFTVLHFDTDMSLENVVKEGNTNLIQMGMQIENHKKISINNYTYYRTVFLLEYNGMKIKQISYTTKAGTTIYNIKFGNEADVIQSNMETIDKIINSFIIK